VSGKNVLRGLADAEAVGRMPGDELVSDPSFNATRAITIDAPPEAVWPWLVQLGYGRAGWYSYDLFDNAARPSAKRILPQYQRLEVGDWVPMSSKVNETTALRVTALVPNRWMLWAKPHSTWAWKLVPIEGGRPSTAPGSAAPLVVERTFAWLHHFKRLLVRYDRRHEIHEAFLAIGCCLVCFRRL
jgi:hypothetical protein